MSYTQLTQEQRYQIQALMKAKHKQTEISVIIGVDKSTVSRELRRNSGLRGYRPKQAHRLALARRQAKVSKSISDASWALVKELLYKQWSPEQISGWLLLEKGFSVSHEWIYQYIFRDKQQGGDLYRHMRCQRKRKKRYGSYNTRGQLTNRITIDERPVIVDKRCRIGDWELDTIIGKGHKQAIVSLCERRSRLCLIAKVKYNNALLVTKAILALLKPLSSFVHTLTSDNGKEFAKQKDYSEKTAEFYESGLIQHHSTKEVSDKSSAH